MSPNERLLPGRDPSNAGAGGVSEQLKRLRQSAIPAGAGRRCTMTKDKQTSVNTNEVTSTEGDLRKLLHDLIDRCNKPAQLVEILYWHEEAELAEVMRQFLALPMSAKSALHAFLAMTEGGAHSVTVTIGPSGLTLSSPMIAEYVRTLSRAAVKPMPAGILH